MTESLSFIIILEFVAPFAILSIILMLALLNSNKKSKKGLSKLLQAVQGGEESYKQKLQEFLKNSGTSEEQIDDLVQKFCKSRRAFFKRALSAISHSDAELLTGLGGQFSEFSDLYHQLSITSQTSNSEADDSDESPDASADESRDELEATYKVVKRENKRLKAEVHVSVSALNSLFGEYASMFGETDKSKSDMSVQEVLDAMEKFTKGDFKPDNITGDIPPDDLAAEEAEKDQEKPAVEDELEATSVADNDSEESVESNEIDEDPLEVKLEDIVVEDDATAESDEADEQSEQPQAKVEEEPNWDEAFEETGETADEAAMEQVKQAENETKDEQTPAQQATEETEPSWDEAFEETGDTVDESAAEQVKQAEQEKQNKATSDLKPDAPSAPEKPPKPE